MIYENRISILTYLHTPFWGSDQFYKSTQRVGLPVNNAWNAEKYEGSVGCIMRMLYEGLLKLKEDGYTHVIYSDAADTYFLKPFIPTDHITISVEKACFPDPALADLYPKDITTPWKYVNAGNWCGSIELAIKFFNDYGLNSHKGQHVNGQREWHHAFFNARRDGFPVEIDTKCEFMQSIAFEDPDDFKIEINRELKEWPVVINAAPKIINLKTNTEPCVFHGNGRTNMDWIYKLND